MPLDNKYLELIGKAIPAAGDEDALKRLSLLYDCVVSTNQKVNITSLVSPIDVTLKHLIDSLSLFCDDNFDKRISGGSICDIGCGGGFPGLPVACVRPQCSITMIDSTEKKIAALRENKNKLSLMGVEPIWGRGEELAGKSGAHREKYDVCVSRAVARLPVLCELCLPFLKKGGCFYAMKGMQTPQEVEESCRAIPMLGGKLVEIKDIKFDFSFADEMDFSEDEKKKIHEFCDAKRYLVVIEKRKETLPVYPRKWSQMTKKSL